jgi:predicted RNA polymerase sigma factor
LTSDATDWPRIAALYERLVAIVPSPVVELNRAVAVGMAAGPAEALPIVDRLAGVETMQRYHLLPTVRGDLLFKLGRLDEAAQQFELAASLTQNAREKQLLLERVRACTAS